MRWLRYPRTPLEILIAGTAFVAATGVLVAIMVALYAVVNAFAVAGFVLVMILIWDFGVERPRRQARVADALAAQSRAVDDIPLRTRAGAADWTEKLPGPIGGIVRTAPATIAALVIIGAALGINGLLGDLINPDRPDGVFVRLRTGEAGYIKQKGDDAPSLRVTLLRVHQWSVDRVERKKYWGAEVEVRNTGRQEVFSPSWTLRAGRAEYNPVAAEAPGDALGASFVLPSGEARAGWVVFEVPLGLTTEWLRATLPDYEALYFASRSFYSENESRWERAWAWD